MVLICLQIYLLWDSILIGSVMRSYRRCLHRESDEMVLLPVGCTIIDLLLHLCYNNLVVAFVPGEIPFPEDEQESVLEKIVRFRGMGEAFVTSLRSRNIIIFC